MRVVVPMLRGKFSRHFGRSDTFIAYEIDAEQKRIISRDEISRENVACHEVAKWLVDEIKADILLTGGIGMPAKRGLERWGVQVIGGVNEDDVNIVIEQYLQNPEAVKLATCWGHEHCKTQRCGQDDD